MESREHPASIYTVWRILEVRASTASTDRLNLTPRGNDSHNLPRNSTLDGRCETATTISSNPVAPVYWPGAQFVGLLTVVAP